MRLENLAYLYNKTLNQVFASAEDLQGFLTASARLYKYPFSDQMVIHAQIKKPEAVATLSQWKKLGRSVNHGAVGTFHFAGGAGDIRGDLFDVGDTGGPEHTLPRLWELPKDTGPVFRSLMIPGEGSFEDTLDRLTNEAVGSVMAAMPADTFPGLDDVQRLLSAAAGYAVAKRLNLPTAIYESVLEYTYSDGDPFAGKSTNDKINHGNRHIPIRSPCAAPN